ncbi:MAG: VOC family protein [Jiangellaceae bacterium]
MTTRLDCVVIDSLDPASQARFWSAATGWPIAMESPDEVAVEPSDGDLDGVPLVFVPVPEAKTVKNRVHLDLRSFSPADQVDTVDMLRDLGAVPADIGQGDVPWVVLADPEGNELCVLEPREDYEDTGPVAAVVLDAAAPTARAAFWSAATGWPVVRGGADYAALRAPGGRGPYIELIGATEPKIVKNRLHVDVAPYPDGDHAAEVGRLTALGATRVDIGQGTVSWTVLADPEGNEFCVLLPR